MRKPLLAISLLLALCAALLAPLSPTSAHAIDYLAMNISPASTFNGSSGNFTVTNPVNGGSDINFDLKYSIVVQGGTTTFPRTVSFGASTISKPLGAPDAVVTGLVSHQFASAASNFTDAITITAPNVSGAYTVEIQPTSGTGSSGLRSGGGITISFTVTNSCANATTALAMVDSCIVYHASSTTLSATLTSGGSPLPGRTVNFTVDGVSAGSAATDSNGVASLSYDPSGLTAGDHTVVANYAGDGCDYDATNASSTLGVTYVFVGFQQPINADGSSSFGGRTIPIKIRVVDANGAPVPDASAHVYFAFGTPAIVGTDAEPVANTNGDSGNAMRYDPVAQQYIFNWDIAGLANGTYTIRVDLGEGSCGSEHLVVVSLKKKGSK